MIRTWLSGLLRHQPARLAGAAAGVAIAVALLASLGAFLAHAKSTMTSRAVASVTVDWQVQANAGADPAAVAALVRATPGVQAAEDVGYLRVAGLSAQTAGSTQSTSSGVVLGVPADYSSVFPGQIRTLTGGGGVLLAQQTAANLHAAPGSSITISLANGLASTATIAGVVDLPQANSVFQTVGAPAGAQPAAPPDNVVLLPANLWNQLASAVQRSHPELITHQIHTKLDHHLPSDPAAAYARAVGAAHHLEAASAGTATVGNNLAAALDAARSDAAYAQILFGFLGLPGAILAGLLTATVSAASAPRRTGEQALLRLRGTSQRQLLRLVGAEAAAVGLLGCIVGLLTAGIVGASVFGSASFGGNAPAALAWAGLAVLAGAAITIAAVLVPARRALREDTVAAGRQAVATLRLPWWARCGLDVLALAGAALIFHATSRNGYQVVLAPEGVPTISVSYWALAAPGLLWLGAGLLCWRLVDLILRARRFTTRILTPLGGPVSGLLSASMTRQRRPLVKATALLALAVAFAVSTATFNATYRTQAEADAQLTNGADVTASAAPGSGLDPGQAGSIASISGVRSVEPIQHRFAYIGADLQDLYGVNPATIRSATAIQDSYFRAGGTAAQLMQTLAARPDSILVSAETVKDYQLNLGDRLNLRLIDGQTHQPITVAFRYVGVVAEFPTAPKDSFFITNATYIAQQTHDPSVGAFLINTGGANTTAVANRVRAALGTSATVVDIRSVRGQVGSSLTAVDLAGLTRVELAFALVLAAAAGGLVLALGLGQRRRSLAIMSAVGAAHRHLRASVVGESALVGVLGGLAGVLLGGGLSLMLVKVLTGVFDPPPSVISIPWLYLGILALLVAACLTVTASATLRLATRRLLPVIRRL